MSKPRLLADDIIDALDGVLELAQRCRDALLRPYVGWGDDEGERVGKDDEGNEVRYPTPRTLGPPFRLDARHYEVRLGP
jgi:hypothetical protein